MNQRIEEMVEKRGVAGGSLGGIRGTLLDAKAGPSEDLATVEELDLDQRTDDAN